MVGEEIDRKRERERVVGERSVREWHLVCYDSGMLFQFGGFGLSCILCSRSDPSGYHEPCSNRSGAAHCHSHDILSLEIIIMLQRI